MIMNNVYFSNFSSNMGKHEVKGLRYNHLAYFHYDLDPWGCEDLVTGLGDRYDYMDWAIFRGSKRFFSFYSIYAKATFYCLNDIFDLAFIIIY